MRTDVDDGRGARYARRSWIALARMQHRLPRGVGISATVLVLGGSLFYGAVKGDHIPMVVAALKDMRDQAAGAAGFGISALEVSGNRHVSRAEVLALAGIGPRTSLLFLDVEEARATLKTNPWIADATVLKLYPDQLQIRIKERGAFALWQTGGRAAVIADDGTVLDTYVASVLLRLPLVVGAGAGVRAKEFLAILDNYPDIRDTVRAAVLVGERRWNLRLKNGLDIRLPESDVAQALDRLVELDREAKLTTRDILAIDLRLPDRVTVRLSPAAAQSRFDALKDKEKKSAKKGGKA